MPTKKPCGQELTLEQQRANQALHHRRLWKDGVRDVVMELCCALHNFRVRLTPWQPMV